MVDSRDCVALDQSWCRVTHSYDVDSAEYVVQAADYRRTSPACAREPDHISGDCVERASSATDPDSRILAAREGERPGRGLVDAVVGDCPVCVASPEHDTPHVQIAGPEEVEDIVVVNYVSCVGQHQANGLDSVLGQATPRRPDVVVGDGIVIDA